MKVKFGAFWNTFGLHYAIIGNENQFWVFLRVAVLHRFYCICILKVQCVTELREDIQIANFMFHHLGNIPLQCFL